MAETTFGGWLAAALDDRGMSMSALAARVGTTRQSVSDWTRGVSAPSLASALLLCDALAVEGEVRDRVLRMAAGLSS